MRHIGLALGTLALIVGLGWINMVTLTRELVQIDEALAAAQETISEEALSRARALWDAADTRLCSVTPHQLVDAVSASLTRAQIRLQEGSPEEARTELAEARDGVRAILYRERLTLGNVL